MKQLLFIVLFGVGVYLAHTHTGDDYAQRLIFMLGAAGCFGAWLAAMADLLDK